MSEKLKPDYYLGSVLEIPLKKLKDDGVKGFMFDLDNTLTEWENLEIKKEIVDWINYLKSNGFKCIIVSNNDYQRIEGIAAKLGVDFLPRAQKPRKRSFLKGVAMLELPREKVVMVGDQLITDVLGAKRCQLKTILVKPLGKKEFWGTKINRCIEKLIMGTWE